MGFGRRGVNQVAEIENQQGEIRPPDETRWARNWEYRWIESFCGYLEVFTVKPGDVIFEEGAGSLFMMVVVNGTVEILKEELR